MIDIVNADLTIERMGTVVQPDVDVVVCFLLPVIGRLAINSQSGDDRKK